MPTAVDEQQLAVAAVYARALLALSERSRSSEATLEELSEVRALLDELPAFASLLTNPTVERRVRKKAVEKGLRGRVSDLVVDTLQVMNRRDRLDLVPALEQAFATQLDRRRGRRKVQVVSAVPLGDAQRTRLRAVLAKLTGGEVRLDESVDEDLAGGLVVRIGDRKLDMSVRGSLAQLTSRLTHRAAAESHTPDAYVVESQVDG